MLEHQNDSRESGAKSTKTSNLLNKEEDLITTFSEMKLAIKSGNVKLQQKLMQIIMETDMQQKHCEKKKNKKRNS